MAQKLSTLEKNLCWFEYKQQHVGKKLTQNLPLSFPLRPGEGDPACSEGSGRSLSSPDRQHFAQRDQEDETHLAHPLSGDTTGRRKTQPKKCSWRYSEHRIRRLACGSYLTLPTTQEWTSPKDKTLLPLLDLCMAGRKAARVSQELLQQESRREISEGTADKRKGSSFSSNTILKAKTTGSRRWGCQRHMLRNSRKSQKN